MATQPLREGGQVGERRIYPAGVMLTLMPFDFEAST